MGVEMEERSTDARRLHVRLPGNRHQSIQGRHSTLGHLRGFNHTDALGLDDDDRLRLAFRLFEAAAQIDPDLELVSSVAQPWGDYLVNENQTISPLTFPDDLIRAGLRVSAVELEIRSGVSPRGSLPRDLLEAYRLLNLFGLLGVPIEVLLSTPSSGEPDPLRCRSVAHGRSKGRTEPSRKAKRSGALRSRRWRCARRMFVP